MEGRASPGRPRAQMLCLTFMRCSAAGGGGMQGARKDGKTPDGQSYLAVAESAAIKALLQA